MSFTGGGCSGDVFVSASAASRGRGERGEGLSTFAWLVQWHRFGSRSTIKQRGQSTGNERLSSRG